MIRESAIGCRCTCVPYTTTNPVGQAPSFDSVAAVAGSSVAGVGVSGAAS